MVGPLALAFDISSVAVSTAIPGAAWALLFAIAWKRPAFAESLGLGPKTFWLLLPGALLASFAVLPFLPVFDDVLAVSFAGAVFPLAIGILTLDRIAPPRRHAMTFLFGALGVEVAVLLGVVVLGEVGALAGLAARLRLSTWGAELALVALLVAVAIALVLTLTRRTANPVDRTLGGLFALISGVAFLTFAGSAAVPGVGIAETFPYFLVPPVLAGLLAVLLARRWFPGREALALPVAFLTAGWGVVLGADVLWEPPLYSATGPSGLYAIGGAGVLDLVYLSGFLGLLAAWGAHRLLGRAVTPVGPALPADPPSPSARLREAFAQGAEGRLDLSLAASAEAARAAGVQAQRLVGRQGVDPAHPWSGLPVPGWVVSDQANLENVARSGTTEAREAYRAYLTARALVRLGERLARPRFASVGERLAAFAIDLTLLGTAGAAVFAGIALLTPGGISGVLLSVGFNAAIYGFVALGFLYLALGELWTGATPGKRLLRIEVRDRQLGPVGGLASFVRNAPLLPVLTLFSLGVAFSVAIAVQGASSTGAFAGLGISAGLALVSLGVVVLAGVGLAGVTGIAVMAVTSERQRVGDLWAGTWVVRSPSEAATPRAALPAAVRSG